MGEKDGESRLLLLLLCIIIIILHTTLTWISSIPGKVKPIASLRMVRAEPQVDSAVCGDDGAVVAWKC